MVGLRGGGGNENRENILFSNRAGKQPAKRALERAVGWEKERFSLIPDVDVIEGKVPCLSHRASSGSNTRYKDPRHT